MPIQNEQGISPFYDKLIDIKKHIHEELNKIVFGDCYHYPNSYQNFARAGTRDGASPARIPVGDSSIGFYMMKNL